MRPHGTDLDAKNVEALFAVAHGLGRMTEAVEGVRGLSLNDVLYTELVTLDSNGIAQRDSSVPAATLIVHNVGPRLVTVAQGGATDRAPRDGIGVARVHSGTIRYLPMAGNLHSFYGAPGKQVHVTALTKPTFGGDAVGPGTVDTIPFPSAFGLAIDGTIATSPTGTPLLLAGFFATEVIGATAEFVLRDGAGGEILDWVKLNPGETSEITYPKPIELVTDTLVVSGVVGTLGANARLQ